MLLCQNKHLLDVAASLQDYTANIRQSLHQIPELSWEETKTITFIKQEIANILSRNTHLEMQFKEFEGGICLDLFVAEERSWLLFRADIDALPIQEKTGLPFASKHPNRMHACGHDCHSAMLLGALTALVDYQITPSHNLRLIWQRAEEYPEGISGGQSLVLDNICEGIDQAYGLHVDSMRESGVFASTSGPMMANAAHLYFKVSCIGGHVMSPEHGISAIDILTDIHSELKDIVHKVLGEKEPISFVPSMSKAGVANNILPNEGEAWYAIRNFLTYKKRSEFVQTIRKTIERTLRQYPLSQLENFTLHKGFPPLLNDASCFDYTRHLLEENHFPVVNSGLLFSGEDFSFYLQKVPGTFWCLGAKQGKGFAHHTPYFNPDESVLWKGVAYWLLLAKNY